MADRQRPRLRPWSRASFTWLARLVIMDDITKSNELEAQLSQADKLSSIGLLAGASLMKSTLR